MSKAVLECAQDERKIAKYQDNPQIMKVCAALSKLWTLIDCESVYICLSLCVSVCMRLFLAMHCKSGGAHSACAKASVHGVHVTPHASKTYHQDLLTISKGSGA